MVGFRAGGENLLETFKLMEYAHSFEGLVSIDQDQMNPNVITLWFETEEDAITAQWILDVMGSEGRKT